MNIFDFLSRNYTETEELANKAISLFYKGFDGDEVYHPLYLAWRSIQNDSTQLNRIYDYATFGFALSVFLNYGTVHDIDDKQQIASIAYLCLSLAIEKEPDIVNLYRNRIMLLLTQSEALHWTIDSVINKDVSVYNPMSFFHTFDAKDALLKMLYSDLSIDTSLMQNDILASKKHELDIKITTGSLGRDQTQESIIAKGKQHHHEICEYLKNKILIEQDIDFS